MGVENLTIQKLGPIGDGIHLGTRGRVYVERTVPGDHLRARIYRDNEGITRGEVLEMLRPSPYRQIPPCKYYERCGNCTLQHLQVAFYRQWKTETVVEAFSKQRLRPVRWLETVYLGGENRRRATFTALKTRGKVVMGYYRRRSDQITDLDSCSIADPKLFELRESLKPFVGELLREGEPVDIFLQRVGSAVDMVIVGPVGRKGEPDKWVFETLNRLLKATTVTRISWGRFDREHTEMLMNRGPVTATFGSLKVDLPPAAFMQPTLEGEQALVKAVLEALPVRAKGKFADFFSGCGTFSGPMLSLGSVDAFESNPFAVRALSNSKGNQSLKVFRRDLFKNPLRREELNLYDAVVFDPPRAGCLEQVEWMKKAKTPLLVGVSCNPTSFARDARLLCDGGYKLKSLQVFDQFLWSHHVEVVGVFTKAERERKT